MSINIKGVDTLIKKLDRLSRIESKKAVEEAANVVLNSIRSGASFSVAGQKAGKCEVRDYGSSYFLDVGFSNEIVSFDEWKPLWFHQWGYFNYGWNFRGKLYINMHQMWFTRAVQAAEEEVKRKIKTRLKEEVRNCMR
ncbi:MAG: hypothetical protein ACRC41_16025 [Sarcina sp.]